jgi:hypothetical protein
LSAVSDHNLGTGRSRWRPDTLNCLDNIHTTDDRTEDYVLPVKPRSLCSTQEELASVGVGASVGHAEYSWSGMPELEILVRELVTIDRLSSGAIVVGEVTTLRKEASKVSAALGTS